jgi:hypothetical protein
MHIIGKQLDTGPRSSTLSGDHSPVFSLSLLARLSHAQCLLRRSQAAVPPLEPLEREGDLPPLAGPPQPPAAGPGPETHVSPIVVLAPAGTLQGHRPSHASSVAQAHRPSK